MALETASFVANLVSSNPDGGDQRSTADDHIRLLKACLIRQFPKCDAAVSLSAAQFHYNMDLSASVQLQLNQLRDGSATANNAINSQFANSASVAANIGTIPAAAVPDLRGTISLTVQEAIRLQHPSGYISGYNAAGSVRTGYVQFTAATALEIVAELSIPVRLYTSNTLRLTINPDGTVTIPGLITGTITQAQNATNAANAVNATNATNAVNATTATTAANALALQGVVPSVSDAVGTLLLRDNSGDGFVRYVNSSAPNSENPSVAMVMVTNGADNYVRKSSAASFGQYVSGQNITGRVGTAKTLTNGSGPPSLVGSTNGDLFYFW